MTIADKILWYLYENENETLVQLTDFFNDLSAQCIQKHREDNRRRALSQNEKGGMVCEVELSPNQPHMDVVRAILKLKVSKYAEILSIGKKECLMWFGTITFEGKRYLMDLQKLEASFSRTEKNRNEKQKNKDSKTTYLQLAFYYYFMQVAEKIKWFDCWDNGREAAYKEVCTTNGKTAKTAWKLFQTAYRLIEGANSKDRWQLCKKSDYPLIIEMLKDCPEALNKAKEQLKETNT